jgi:putative ABC transport system permease protein
MNIMLVTVTERTREIGVRMAVGARSWHIVGQFLADALALSLAGGAIGIALGLTITGQLAARFHMPSVIHWNVIALAVGFSAAVGGGSGCTPRARRRGSTRSVRCASSDRRGSLATHG